jgi:hypothetical protein
MPVERLAQRLAAEEHNARLSRMWKWDGALERIHDALDVAVREQEGRKASLTAAIINSRTAKGA